LKVTRADDRLLAADLRWERDYVQTDASRQRSLSRVAL